MARRIKDVLTESELGRLNSITDKVSDLSKAGIVSNVSHIFCDISNDPNTNGEILQARVYLDPRQPYERVYEKLKMRPRQGIASPAAERDYEAMANTLLAMRRGHSYEFKDRPHERKSYEASLRKAEIEANRHYLREAEGKDPGIFIAAAHWLKEYSNVYCSLAEAHYREIGVDGFSLLGMERAVVIAASGKGGEDFLSVLVLSSDLTFEETAAQYATGVDRFAAESPEKFNEKYRKMREEMAKAEEAMHFCVLGGKRTK